MMIRIDKQELTRLREISRAAYFLYNAYDGIKAIRDSGSIPVWERLREALGYPPEPLPALTEASKTTSEAPEPADITEDSEEWQRYLKRRGWQPMPD